MVPFSIAMLNYQRLINFVIEGIEGIEGIEATEFPLLHKNSSGLADFGRFQQRDGYPQENPPFEDIDIYRYPAW